MWECNKDLISDPWWFFIHRIECHIFSSFVERCLFLSRYNSLKVDMDIWTQNISKYPGSNRLFIVLTYKAWDLTETIPWGHSEETWQLIWVVLYIWTQYCLFGQTSHFKCLNPLHCFTVLQYIALKLFKNLPTPWCSLFTKHSADSVLIGEFEMECEHNVNTIGNVEIWRSRWLPDDSQWASMGTCVN